jgi:hypothetical protein
LGSGLPVKYGSPVDPPAFQPLPHGAGYAASDNQLARASSLQSRDRLVEASDRPVPWRARNKVSDEPFLVVAFPFFQYGGEAACLPHLR